MAKERILSLTRDDFEWEYFRAGGKGGQNQNKTSSAARVRHPPSGAVAESRTERDQLGNRREAFKKIANDPVFRDWLKAAAAELNGHPSIEQKVALEMQPDKLRVEVRKNGKWINDR